MSFFDEDDELTVTTTRRPPERPFAQRPRPGAASARSRGERPDRGTIRRRQLGALGVGVVLVLVLFFGAKGCLDSRKNRSLRAYARQVSAIAASSDERVSRPFFELLERGAQPAARLQAAVGELRAVAERDAGHARALSTPSDMRRAQNDLLLVLDLRVDALGKIAVKLPTALVRRSGANPIAQRAAAQIAGQMQALLASDVIYSQRVAPLIQQTLQDAGLAGPRVRISRFLPSIDWLAPKFVAEKIGAQIGGAAATIKPGRHGHGLTGVSVGPITLKPSPTVNHISVRTPLSFTVTFANQGDNDETAVPVVVRIVGAGRPITARKTVAQTKRGTTAQVTIPLGKTPPIGRPVTIEVQVLGVPGEKNIANNRRSFTALFTR
jgi:hypothetical protein